MYLQVPSRSRTLRLGRPKLAKKQCKLANLMLVILAAPARSCASSESVSRHEKNSEPSNKPRMERSIPAPPSQGGCLPKDQRENEPKFYVKRSSEPHFMPGKRYSLPNLPYK